VVEVVNFILALVLLELVHDLLPPIRLPFCDIRALDERLEGCQRWAGEVDLATSEKGPQSITNEEEVIPFVIIFIFFWIAYNFQVQNGRACVYFTIRLL